MITLNSVWSTAYGRGVDAKRFGRAQINKIESPDAAAIHWPGPKYTTHIYTSMRNSHYLLLFAWDTSYIRPTVRALNRFGISKRQPESSVRYSSWKFSSNRVLRVSGFDENKIHSVV